MYEGQDMCVRQDICLGQDMCVAQYMGVGQSMCAGQDMCVGQCLCGTRYVYDGTKNLCGTWPHFWDKVRVWDKEWHRNRMEM